MCECSEHLPYPFSICLGGVCFYLYSNQVFGCLGALMFIKEHKIRILPRFKLTCLRLIKSLY